MLLACLSPAALAGQSEQISAQAKAQSIHARALVLDTHLDTPLLFARPGWDIMDRHSADADFSYVDYPRMIDGGLDGGFWAIWTAQGEQDLAGKRKARDAGLRRLMDIREMVAAHRDHWKLPCAPTTRSASSTPTNAWSTSAWRMHRRWRPIPACAEPITHSACACWVWSIPRTTILPIRPRTRTARVRRTQ